MDRNTLLILNISFLLVFLCTVSAISANLDIHCINSKTCFDVNQPGNNGDIGIAISKSTDGIVHVSFPFSIEHSDFIANGTTEFSIVVQPEIELTEAVEPSLSSLGINSLPAGVYLSSSVSASTQMCSGNRRRHHFEFVTRELTEFLDMHLGLYKESGISVAQTFARVPIGIDEATTKGQQNVYLGPDYLNKKDEETGEITCQFMSRFLPLKSPFSFSNSDESLERSLLSELFSIPRGVIRSSLEWKIMEDRVLIMKNFWIFIDKSFENGQIDKNMLGIGLQRQSEVSVRGITWIDIGGPLIFKELSWEAKSDKLPSLTISKNNQQVFSHNKPEVKVLLDSHDLASTGAHRNLVTSLRFQSNGEALRDSCDVLVLQYLPPSMFFDTYELKERARFGLEQTVVYTVPDLEVSAESDAAAGVFVGIRMNANFSDGGRVYRFEVPVHLRYQLPGIRAHRSVSVPIPLIFHRCYSHCGNDNYVSIQYKQTTTPATSLVPVGNLLDRTLIGFGTTLLTLVGVLIVIVVIGVSVWKVSPREKEKIQ